MHLLYSNILPLNTVEGNETIQECILKQFDFADSIDIAVGYVSRHALEELDRLVIQKKITRISLIMGMYYVEGMPEGTYNVALEINRKWMESGIGEIVVVKAFQYHGKIYCFSKRGKPYSAIIGSANLGILKLDASNRRQYELAIFTEDNAICCDAMGFIENLKSKNCSANISQISDMPRIREENTSLSNIDGVNRVPPSAIQLYSEHKTETSFPLPIKVPSTSERFMDDGKHYTKSNINVSYAAPRSRRMFIVK